MTSTSLDEDYSHVARRRELEQGTESVPPRRRVGPLGALALAAFTVLAVTAAAQTSRNEVSSETQRQELISQVRDARGRVDATRERWRALRLEDQQMQEAMLASGEKSRGLLRELELLRVQAGYVPVSGPGVTVVVDDAPGAQQARNQVLDSDLQRLANGLWEAGAEAISINGQRITSLTAIRTAGDAVTVNLRSLRRPYTVKAIGNRDTLPARFAETPSGQAWLDLQRQVGLQFSITTARELRLPAGPSPVLRHATAATTNATKDNR